MDGYRVESRPTHALDEAFFSPRIFQQPEKRYDYFTPTTQKEAALESSGAGAAGSVGETLVGVLGGQTLHTSLKPARGFLSREHMMLRCFGRSIGTPCSEISPTFQHATVTCFVFF